MDADAISPIQYIDDTWSHDQVEYGDAPTLSLRLPVGSARRQDDTVALLHARSRQPLNCCFHHLAQAEGARCSQGHVWLQVDLTVTAQRHHGRFQASVGRTVGSNEVVESGASVQQLHNERNHAGMQVSVSARLRGSQRRMLLVEDRGQVAVIM